MYDVEAEVVHEVADAERDHDRLIRCDLSEGAAVEVIKVGMGD
jgi:hypothetical protein